MNWRLLRWVPFVLMLLIVVGDRIANGRRGEGHHQMLIQEFKAITPPVGASTVSRSDNFSVWNSRKALVGARYTTNLSFSDIQDFYNRELESLGWHFVNDRPIADWGKDVGREISYCKGELAATLQYAGMNAHYGWTYALDLTWGLEHCS